MHTDTKSAKQNYDIETFLEIYSISRSRFYAEVKREYLHITKLGNRTYVTRQDAEAWLQKIRDESKMNVPNTDSPVQLLS